MPRKARIDAPGSLHHIIARGIGRRKVFDDNEDRDFFIERLGKVVSDTETQCFAWALIPNHFHLLLKTGITPIATVMKRLLTGYAMHYNRRHKRYGHPSPGGSTTFSKPIQVNPLPGGFISIGTDALCALEPASGKIGV